MKSVSALGKTLLSLFIIVNLVIAAIYLFLLLLLGDYSEPSVGIEPHPIFQDNTFDKYRIPLKEANKQYFYSNDIYYFFAKETKEFIAERCIEIYLKEHNITDVDGWRFPKNVYLEYIQENNISDDFVDKKFTNSLRESERLGYKDPQWFHDYDYNKKINCNLSMDENFEAYVKGYRKFYGARQRDYNNDWVDHLFFNYK